MSERLACYFYSTRVHHEPNPTMAPPSATMTETETSDSSKPSTLRPLEVGLSEPQAKVQMPKFPGPPTFEDKYEERDYLKGRLAAAFRIFGKFGFDEGVAGHITLRDPVDPTTFWVNPLGLSFHLIKKSDLIQVDHSGKVIDGGPNRMLNSAAFMIHSAIHEARPDVMCAAHSHSIYGRSFSTLGRPLDIITQDACVFWNVSPLYSRIVHTWKQMLTLISSRTTPFMRASTA